MIVVANGMMACGLFCLLARHMTVETNGVMLYLIGQRRQGGPRPAASFSPHGVLPGCVAGISLPIHAPNGRGRFAWQMPVLGR